MSTPRHAAYLAVAALALRERRSKSRVGGERRSSTGRRIFFAMENWVYIGDMGGYRSIKSIFRGTDVLIVSGFMIDFIFMDVLGA